MRLQLLRLTWENPHPEKKIVKFDFVSFNNSICSPFLLAATAEIPAKNGNVDEPRANNSEPIHNVNAKDGRLSSRMLSDIEDSEEINNLRELGAFLESDGSRKLIKVSLSGPGPNAGRPRGTDGNVELVSRIPSVEFLDVAWSNITNTALTSANSMPNLRSLNLNLTQVTDGGLRHLEANKSLERLWLNRTKITDEGIKTLSQMTNLKVLDLSGTAVTDAGLEHLKTLMLLEDLDLRETRTTDAGIATLSQLLPKARIRH
jgi:hypothetical protein